MGQDTSEYTNKAERKFARKITKHPVYQKVRMRALEAEKSSDSLRKDLAETANRVAKAEQQVVELKNELDALKNPHAPKAEEALVEATPDA